MIYELLAICCEGAEGKQVPAELCHLFVEWRDGFYMIIVFCLNMLLDIANRVIHGFFSCIRIQRGRSPFRSVQPVTVHGKPHGIRFVYIIKLSEVIATWVIQY